MSSEKHLTRGAGKIAIGTTLSRILGYIRDMMVAHAFGAGLLADAYYAAYRIPNLFRRLLGEGSLSPSFIPVLSQYLHTKTKEETQELINVVFTVLTIILSVLTILGIFFAPYLVNIIAYGFASEPEKLKLTIDLTRLMFPFLLFICLAALALGVLNTLSAFFIPAIAPAALSVSEIGFILAIAPMLSPDNQIRGLAISVIIGGLGQFIVQWPQIVKLGWHLKWRLNLKHPGLKQIGLLILPSIIGLSVDQIDAFINTICASFLEEGAITALYYSNRLMQMPLAIFGIALASAALPAMSKCVAEKDIKSVKNILNYSIRLIIFILVPAATGLMVLGLPIITTLFQRGKFSLHASMLTDSALFYYSLGLPAYAIAKVLASTFYSFQERAVPVKIGIISVLINAVLNVLLMGPLGVGGLALATALASYFNAFALAYVLRQRLGPIGIKKIIVTTLKTISASAIMAVICYMIAFKFLAVSKMIGMITSLTCGVGVYFLFSILFKIEERKPLLSIIFKEKSTSVDD